jgi:hypothetical protein
VAARQIIVLDVRVTDILSVTASLWITVPAPLVKPAPGAGSALPPVAAAVAWGITPAELAAIQAGAVREVVTTITGPTTATPAQVEARLISVLADQQNALSGQAPAAKWIGAYFDGTTWTLPP